MVRLAVEDAVALGLDDGAAEGLGDVTLAGAWRAEEERVLASLHEAAGGQLEDEAAIHLLVEVEVEAVERLSRVAEGALLEAALDEAVASASQLVVDEGGEEVERSELLGLRLEDASLDGLGHAGQAQGGEGAGDFDEIHVSVSPG
ncbi:hypothetical protein QEG98_02360 [Myxococcus sp. MxC21-1]|nr:hypothetical protein [Myxococcus sp. MxC21-1]WNZ62690.1 hypothetical protein QEG98_02360 [Myxococcus sp. MxC21-1]